MGTVLVWCCVVALEAPRYEVAAWFWMGAQYPTQSLRGERHTSALRLMDIPVRGEAVWERFLFGAAWLLWLACLAVVWLLNGRIPGCYGGLSLLSLTRLRLAQLVQLSAMDV